MIGRTRRENGGQISNSCRMGIRQFGISDLGCPRMEEVLRAPAAHGVSSIRFTHVLKMLSKICARAQNFIED